MKPVPGARRPPLRSLAWEQPPAGGARAAGFMLQAGACGRGKPPFSRLGSVSPHDLGQVTSCLCLSNLRFQQRRASPRVVRL